MAFMCRTINMTNNFWMLCHPNHVMKSCFHVWPLPINPAQFVEPTCFGVFGYHSLTLNTRKTFGLFSEFFFRLTSSEMSHLYEGACGIIFSGLLHSNSSRLSKSQWSEKPYNAMSK